MPVAYCRFCGQPLRTRNVRDLSDLSISISRYASEVENWKKQASFRRTLPRIDAPLLSGEELGVR